MSSLTGHPCSFTATAFNAGYKSLFNDVAVTSGCQQHASSLLVAMVRRKVNVEVGPWEANGTALSAFELVVVDNCGVAIIRPLDTAESCRL